MRDAQTVEVQSAQQAQHAVLDRPESYREVRRGVPPVALARLLRAGTGQYLLGQQIRIAAAVRDEGLRGTRDTAAEGVDQTGRGARAEVLQMQMPVRTDALHEFDQKMLVAGRFSPALARQQHHPNVFDPAQEESQP
nr:hypothetical protein [Streptomyces sp. Termitarium-T10T-6]